LIATVTTKVSVLGTLTLSGILNNVFYPVVIGGATVLKAGFTHLRRFIGRR